jgi:hypothetical protein
MIAPGDHLEANRPEILARMGPFVGVGHEAMQRTEQRIQQKILIWHT